jgi:hypothetical protein
MPATDEDVVRDLLHRYTAHVRPPASIATGVAARQRHRERRRRVSLTAAGAALGVAAGVIAVVPGRSPAPAPKAAAGAAPKAAAGNPKLVSLADYIKASSGSLPGNASLVIRNQTIGHGVPEVTYNLYTDGGAYYSGDNKSTLRQAIAQHANIAGGQDAREAAAARYAVTGNLTTARERMIDAIPNWFGFGLSAAAQKRLWEKAAAQARPILRAKGVKTPLKQPTGQALQDDINNYLWNNSVDALTQAGGNPRIRAGVFRLLSTIPEVTVVNSVTGGQPTLTVTAGAALFGGDSSPQVLTVSARTGVPVSSVFAAKGTEPSSVDTFQVSRVTLANVEAGKF